MKLPETKPSHRRYYMPSEVAQHNTPEDCWLSWFGEVYDLSPVLEQHKGEVAPTTHYLVTPQQVSRPNPS